LDEDIEKRSKAGSQIFNAGTDPNFLLELDAVTPMFLQRTLVLDGSLTKTTGLIDQANHYQFLTVKPFGHSRQNCGDTVVIDFTNR